MATGIELLVLARVWALQGWEGIDWRIDLNCGRRDLERASLIRSSRSSFLSSGSIVNKATFGASSTQQTTSHYNARSGTGQCSLKVTVLKTERKTLDVSRHACYGVSMTLNKSC